MYQMREKFMRFMQGRNGFDEFGKFLNTIVLVLLIVSILASAFTMFVSLFQNFSLQKRGAIFNCCLLAGYYIVLLVFVLILRGDTRLVEMHWQMCLPLVSLILAAMSFYSIRMTEAKMLARANNFRLRD